MLRNRIYFRSVIKPLIVFLLQFLLLLLHLLHVLLVQPLYLFTIIFLRALRVGLHEIVADAVHLGLERAFLLFNQFGHLLFNPVLHLVGHQLLPRNEVFVELLEGVVFEDLVVSLRNRVDRRSERAYLTERVLVLVALALAALDLVERVLH